MKPKSRLTNSEIKKIHECMELLKDGNFYEIKRSGIEIEKIEDWATYYIKMKEYCDFSKVPIDISVLIDGAYGDDTSIVDVPFLTEKNEISDMRAYFRVYHNTGVIFLRAIYIP
jgi:hypothetical protein